MYLAHSSPIYPANTTYFSNQHSASSNHSSDHTMSPSAKTKQYGPISVRVRGKSMPTLETGRRSKHLVLVGEEAMKREQRRERNREAARKLKEKRHIIEDELIEKVVELENQQSYLQNFIGQLHQQKHYLHAELNEVNHQLWNEIDQLLSNDGYDSFKLGEQYSPDMKLFDDAFEEILNSHLKTCFDLSPQN